MDIKKRADTGLWGLFKMGGLTPAIASMFGAQNAQQMAFIRSVMKEQRNKTLMQSPLDSLETVIFDLETTGFSAYGGDEILSIGAVLVVGGTVHEQKTFYTLVNPERDIPPNIVELTGITAGMVARAPSIIDALSDFLEYVGTRLLVAHGTGHDRHFLNAALWRTSRTSLEHRMLDTMLITKWLYPRQQDLSLDTLLDLHGIEIKNRHHALEDSLMTAKLWVEYHKKMLQKDILTLGDLYMRLSMR
jgi:DNA polymerase-3 subunit epsilon